MLASLGERTSQGDACLSSSWIERISACWLTRGSGCTAPRLAHSTELHGSSRIASVSSATAVSVKVALRSSPVRSQRPRVSTGIREL